MPFQNISSSNQNHCNFNSPGRTLPFEHRDFSDENYCEALPRPYVSLRKQRQIPQPFGSVQNGRVQNRRQIARPFGSVQDVRDERRRPRSMRQNLNEEYSTRCLFRDTYHKLVMPRKYRFVESIGSGSFGQVFKAEDMSHDGTDVVAIKKISNPLNNCMIAGIQAVRELMIMEHIHHPNVVSADDIWLDESRGNFDLYIAMEFCELTLLDFVNGSQRLPENLVASLTKQICTGLDYLHGCGIIHGDLKPDNILCSNDGTVKICDFGLSQTVFGGRNLNTYITSRWYRAPQVLLKHTPFNCALDMWAVGCIAAELMTGEVLFKGKDQHQQLGLIIEYFGRDIVSQLDWLPSDRARLIMQIAVKYSPSTFLVDSRCSPEAIDFCNSLLTFSPMQRLTASQASKHHFLYNTPSNPRSEDVGREVFDCSYERNLNNIEDIKNVIRKECAKMNLVHFKLDRME